MENIEVLKFIVGSKLFRLDTPDSDTDYLSIYVNPDQATDPTAKTTTHTEDKDRNTETISVELNTFMRAVGSDLKYREALGASVNLSENRCATTFHPLMEYVSSIDYSQVYIREIVRRYSKSWYAEINPSAKNFNAGQGYDSKYAAHLFRVLNAGQHYAKTGKIKVDFTDIREQFLGIRSGKFPKQYVFEHTTTMKETVLDALSALNPHAAKPVPVRWYFETALKLS